MGTTFPGNEIAAFAPDLIPAYKKYNKNIKIVEIIYVFLAATDFLFQVVVLKSKKNWRGICCGFLKLQKNN